MCRDYTNNTKITSTNFKIPTFNEYDIFKTTYYKVDILKTICKSYHLKRNGNKSQLIDRIYTHLLQSNFAIILQKYIRKYFIQNFLKLKGPALYDRSLCTNATDFFSFEKLDSISYNEFFSYKDDNNNIWGFNIISFYNLFIKSENKNNILNPYNRHVIMYKYYINVKSLIRYSNILKQPVNINLDNNIDSFDLKKKLQFKSLELFQYIDSLGNYTDVKWFSTLNHHRLIEFIRSLLDIWEYRAQLTLEIKKQICFPHGNPFRYTNLNEIIYYNFFSLQKIALSIIEQFIKKGIDSDSCNLGASYVLCALTLVNNDAAIAMPWLYQSVSTI